MFPHITEPEMVLPISAHPAFEKAGSFLDVKVRLMSHFFLLRLPFFPPSCCSLRLDAESFCYSACSACTREWIQRPLPSLSRRWNLSSLGTLSSWLDPLHRLVHYRYSLGVSSNRLCYLPGMWGRPPFHPSLFIVLAFSSIACGGGCSLKCAVQ